MHLKLFASKSPLDEASTSWIFDVFRWAFTHLDAQFFYHDTKLVTPTNEHFPGRAARTRDMAELIFEQTLDYAGMAHWPMQLTEPHEVMLEASSKVVLPAPLRVKAIESDPISRAGAKISISYNPALVKNPEAMIAGYAQVLAHYLGSTVNEAPPGGLQNWPQTTEVLGVFLGFGVLFANTAFNFKNRACGSCSGPPIEREVYLSQYDITYALALFCTLKSIPNNQVFRHLKRSLRPHFKHCRKDVERRVDALAQLRSVVENRPQIQL